MREVDVRPKQWHDVRHVPRCWRVRQPDAHGEVVVVQYRTTRGYEFDDGAPGTGTYRVKHYSLELTYDNGHTKRAVFYIDPGKASGDVTAFWFNEYLFARVQ
jgi:hypothetical protein